MAAQLTKKVTFRSKDLGNHTTLLLCIAPPSKELYVTKFPVAWKVTTLAAKGTSVFTVLGTNATACCVAQVGGGQFVSAGNYAPITLQQRTSLLLDASINPPVYYFSDPVNDVSAQNEVQVDNGTPVPANIGFGFISNAGSDNEQLCTVLMCPDVAPGASVWADYVPLVQAYINFPYQENQMLDDQFKNIRPLWEADMRELHLNTTVVIERTPTGGYQARQVAASMSCDHEL